LVHYVTHPQLTNATWRGPATADTRRAGGAVSFFREFPMVSMIIGFGVATLFATVILFAVQIFDDLRNA
jgi:hypothetical protein